MLLLLTTTVALAAVPPPPVAVVPDAPVPPPVEPSPDDPARQAELAPPPPPPPVEPDDTLKLVDTRDGGFRVENGAGIALSGERFASLVGDVDYFVEKRRDQRRVTTSRLVLYSGGAALLGIGLYAALADGPHAPQLDDYTADPDAYASYAEYEQAYEQLHDQYDSDYDRYKEGRLWSGAFFGVTGVFAIAAAPFLGHDVVENRHYPDRVYTRSRASTLIDRYNAAHVQPLLGPGTVGVTGSF